MPCAPFDAIKHRRKLELRQINWNPLRSFGVVLSYMSYRAGDLWTAYGTLLLKIQTLARVHKLASRGRVSLKRLVAELLLEDKRWTR